MKRFIALLVCAGAMTSAVLSQSARQGAPQPSVAIRDSTKAVDEAAAQLTQLNASQARLADVGTKMVETHSALGGKIAVVCGLRNKVTTADAAKAVLELCEFSTSSNKQMLTLQEKMQNENRQFRSISNTMKTRHDVAKSSMSNVR